MPRPAPSFHDVGSRTTVLRTDWSPQGVQLAIDWSRPDVQMELSAGGDVVFAGQMPPRAVADRPLVPRGAWDVVCWEADDEADYLELELSFVGGARLQRQFVLSRRDGLLWIADGVLDAPFGRIECAVNLPLAAAVQCAGAEETREAVLHVGRRKQWLLVPPSLPEWRAERRSGTMTSAGRRVVVRHAVERAAALYVPICIVVDPRRARRPCTWRQLTVGEDLRIQPADRAVGYRIQLGREQWLVYRSLTPRANRTVLGVNLQSDFLLARFLRTGRTATLMAIEACDEPPT